jgi:hypothetical protein
MVTRSVSFIGYVVRLTLLSAILSFDQIVKYACFQFVIAKIRETKRVEPSDSTLYTLNCTFYSIAPQHPNTGAKNRDPYSPSAWRASSGSHPWVVRCGKAPLHQRQSIVSIKSVAGGTLQKDSSCAGKRKGCLLSFMSGYSAIIESLYRRIH